MSDIQPPSPVEQEEVWRRAAMKGKQAPQPKLTGPLSRIPFANDPETASDRLIEHYSKVGG